MERERGKREEIEKSASSVTLSAERNCIPESERGPLPPPVLLLIGADGIKARDGEIKCAQPHKR